MDKEMMEQFQLILRGMADMEKRLEENIQSQLRESETRTRVFIENEVSKRIDSANCVHTRPSKCR